MNILFDSIMILFWIILIFYSILTVAGVWFRVTFKEANKLAYYPSVAVLIPAYNEGIVMSYTLRAMARLRYPGKLNIYVLNDHSTDNTGEIADEFAKLFSHIHHIRVPTGEPKGKSRVLNYGLSISESDYFMIYDADNEPEPDALVKLIEQAEVTPNAAGAVGYVKTKNSEVNALTRMISLEFQVFQLLMQCGRWALFKLGSLAGTNMLLKRSIIEEVGGYDPYALAEDAELTVRITALGYLIPVVPTSKTWEQEPEKLSTYFKQRTRWFIGNIYLLEKSLLSKDYWKGRTLFLSLQHVMTYSVFVVLLLVSDIFFVLSILGMMTMYKSVAPLLILWFMSYIVYTMQLLSALAVDRNITFINVCFIIIMYFTYAQLFLIKLIRSFVIYTRNKIKKQTIEWEKTARFDRDDNSSP
ncbi:glycosyltransferase [Virgibacillus soli]